MADWKRTFCGLLGLAYTYIVNPSLDDRLCRVAHGPEVRDLTTYLDISLFNSALYDLDTVC